MARTANAALVARRYAQAALELALEGDSLEQWRTDLATLTQIWNGTRIGARLDDPKMGRARRLQEARSALEGHIGPLALNLVLLLVGRGRAGLIPEIGGAFARLEMNRERRITAYVTSALPLTETQRAHLRETIGRRTNRTVTLDERVDPAIMGGLVVRIGDELIDASVAGRLRRIEAQLRN